MSNQQDELRKKIEAMSEEEKVEFAKTAVKTVTAINLKMMLDDPHEYNQSLKYVRARRETDTWACHRSAEGMA